MLAQEDTIWPPPRTLLAVLQVQRQDKNKIRNKNTAYKRSTENNGTGSFKSNHATGLNLISHRFSSVLGHQIATGRYNDDESQGAPFNIDIRNETRKNKKSFWIKTVTFESIENILVFGLGTIYKS